MALSHMLQYYSSVIYQTVMLHARCLYVHLLCFLAKERAASQLFHCRPIGAG